MEQDAFREAVIGALRALDPPVVPVQAGAVPAGPVRDAQVLASVAQPDGTWLIRRVRLHIPADPTQVTLRAGRP